MAVKLDTVKDFLAVERAFQDKNSQPHQYTIVDFGFCTVCNKITHYQGDYGPEECSKHCFECHNTFSARKFPSALEFKKYFGSLDKLPLELEEVSKKLQELRSRKHQQEIFRRLLTAKLLEKLNERERIQLEIDDLYSIVLIPNK